MQPTEAPIQQASWSASAAQVSPDVRARIISAAEEPYAESGYSKKPTVAAVRKRAHANINEVGPVLIEWWNQKMQNRSVSAEIPAELHAMIITAFAPLWQAASGRAAQALTEERANCEAKLKEQKLHYDEVVEASGEQANELANALAEVEQLSGRVAALEAELADAKAAHASAAQEKERAVAEARYEGLRQGYADLSKFLERGREQLPAARAEGGTTRREHGDEIERVPADVTPDAAPRAEQNCRAQQAASHLHEQASSPVSTGTRPAKDPAAVRAKTSRRPVAGKDGSATLSAKSGALGATPSAPSGQSCDAAQLGLYDHLDASSPPQPPAGIDSAATRPAGS